MITITIESSERFSDATSEFYKIEGGVYHLEHSLYSISKWEGKYHKSFIENTNKSVEETLDYYSMMNLDDSYFNPLELTNEQAKQIADYINDSATAQKFYEDERNNKVPSKEIITSELIYYWMSALNIPMECQYWHFNKLTALIRLASIKNAPEEKETKEEALKRTRETNLAMRAKYSKKK